ncbi:hypothetical protein [Candidatus Uabimicrobium sp. HlEnr_7]|uniref:Dph6-related ATP pyrophosphatase n=1 Tax=Candidatus Uabimicrobium helgolandensis TaxID=3095367 RepID=UPI00355605D5
MENLEIGLATIRQSPKKEGILELIARQSVIKKWEILQEAKLDQDEGLVGDIWKTSDKSQPDTQLTIVNCRLMTLIEPDKSRWPLSESQLYIDMDLSRENLPPGTQLALGTAIIEITSVPHNKYENFAEQFGQEALKFVNSSIGMQLNLSGIHAKVVNIGTVQVSNIIRKMSDIKFNRDEDCPNKPFDKDFRFFCSWSGGKDSCLSLYRAMQTGAIPSYLVTMLSAETNLTKTHELDSRLIEAQSQALGIPLRPCPFVEKRYGDYEKAFLTELLRLSKIGVQGGIFGDTEYGLSLTNTTCAKAGMKAWVPLWQVDPIAAFNEFLDLGFKSIIMCCSNSKLGKEAIGQTLTKDLLKFIIDKGIDPLGEHNEYHTFVYDGPIFSKPVQFTKGNIKRVGDYWIDELKPAKKRWFSFS